MVKKFILFLLVLGGALTSSPVLAAGSLLKATDSSTVYYLDGNNIRHPFPTEDTYYSWYDSFSEVAVLTSAEIAKYPLGANVTIRPGNFIAKFATDSNYYAVEPGGVLRLITDNGLLSEIFGADWIKRVVDLPDAFFGDYLMGEPIKYSHQLPSGIIYQQGKNGTYYYKAAEDLIWPFKDFQAVLANGLKASDIVINPTVFNERRRQIDGFDSRIFNPAAEPALATNDCENKHLKVAFILVTKDGYQPAQMEKITAIQDKLEQTFSWATKGLAEIDASFPVVVLGDDDYLLFKDTDGQDKPDNEVINTFYDIHPDVFDFIVLYNNFVLAEPVIAKYLTVTNDFSGTGNARMRSAFNFGSGGKLKGIANMGNINKYNIDVGNNLDLAVNYILHELGHHFSGRARFVDDSGIIRTDLLVDKDFQHWHMYVNAVSPLGGNGWASNGDGSFTNVISTLANPDKKQYSDLDLYFMGLLPKIAVSPISYLVPDKPGEVGNRINGHLEEVIIDQIIKAMGDWQCILN